MKTKIKHIIYVTFLLLLPLGEAGWGLTSCRSPKTMTYSTATTDSVNLSVKDSTTQHFSFTFDSLVFSTTELTECTDIDLSLSEKERLCAASVSSVSSVVNKNLPCSRLVVYGGKVNAEQSKFTAQDSTSNKTIHEVKKLDNNHFGILALRTSGPLLTSPEGRKMNIPASLLADSII